MLLFGRKFQTFTIQEHSVDQSSIKILEIGSTEFKFLKQFRKLLEPKNDQHTAKKACGGHNVDCYLKKLNTIQS